MAARASFARHLHLRQVKALLTLCGALDRDSDMKRLPLHVLAILNAAVESVPVADCAGMSGNVPSGGLDESSKHAVLKPM